MLTYHYVRPVIDITSHSFYKRRYYDANDCECDVDICESVSLHVYRVPDIRYMINDVTIIYRGESPITDPS